MKKKKVTTTILKSSIQPIHQDQLTQHSLIMADRLTQLQICLDQLIQQFNSTINYVNTSAEPSLLDDDDVNSYSNMAANAPLPQSQQQRQQQKKQQEPQQEIEQPQQQSNLESKSTSPPKEKVSFDNVINELCTDLILKSRQIKMLIDSLPGIGVTPNEQMNLINELSDKLQAIEEERIQKIKEKDNLLNLLESMIKEVVNGITETRI